MMSYIIVNKEWCKGCELCVVACPKKIIALEDGFNSQGYHPAKLIDADKCTGCKGNDIIFQPRHQLKAGGDIIPCRRGASCCNSKYPARRARTGKYLCIAGRLFSGSKG